MDSISKNHRICKPLETFTVFNDFNDLNAAQRLLPHHFVQVLLFLRANRAHPVGRFLPGLDFTLLNNYRIHGIADAAGFLLLA
jgi:hypothetical protein